MQTQHVNSLLHSPLTGKKGIALFLISPYNLKINSIHLKPQSNFSSFVLGYTANKYFTSSTHKRILS